MPEKKVPTVKCIVGTLFCAALMLGACVVGGIVERYPSFPPLLVFITAIATYRYGRNFSGWIDGIGSNFPPG